MRSLDSLQRLHRPDVILRRQSAAHGAVCIRNIPMSCIRNAIHSSAKVRDSTPLWIGNAPFPSL